MSAFIQRPKVLRTLHSEPAQMDSSNFLATVTAPLIVGGTPRALEPSLKSMPVGDVRQEEQELLRELGKVLKQMIAADGQKIIDKGVTNGLEEMEALLDRIGYFRRRWLKAEEDQKTKTG